MESVRQYFLSVVTAAVFCGMINSLMTKGAAQSIVKLVCGILLTVTLIRPLIRLDMESAIRDLPYAIQDAEAIVSEGEIVARQAMEVIIKERSEAYILDKAASLKADVTAEVFLSEDDPPVPVSVRIMGKISPYAKRRLRELIESDLGVPEEDQVWME